MLSEAKYKAKCSSDLKIVSRKQLLSRLSIALAKVKAGNTSENLLNEISQSIYSLYQSKELLKTYTMNYIIMNCNIMNSIKS